MRTDEDVLDHELWISVEEVQRKLLPTRCPSEALDTVGEEDFLILGDFCFDMF